MIKKVKKGFTLIELVVVIAVIAILSAVSVISYVSITNSAKKSADEQAVKQMNTALMANEILTPSSIVELYDVLEESGYSAKDYSPLAKDRYFFWDSTLNRILYTDKDMKVIFPKEYEGKTYSEMTGHQWFSLNSSIEKQSYGTIVDSGTVSTVSITTGGALSQLVDDMADNKMSATFPSKVNTGDAGIVSYGGDKLVVKLTQDIDLMGAPFFFSGFHGDFELDGDGHTIRGMVNATSFSVSTSNNENKEKGYGAGIVGYAFAGSNVSIHDVNFENCESGAYKVTKSDGTEAAFNNNGLLIGCCYGNASISNVSFTNCNVYANKRSALLVGHAVQNAVVTLSGNIDIVNSGAYCKEEVAGLILNKQCYAPPATTDTKARTTVTSTATISIDDKSVVKSVDNGAVGKYGVLLTSGLKHRMNTQAEFIAGIAAKDTDTL